VDDTIYNHISMSFKTLAITVLALTNTLPALAQTPAPTPTTETTNSTERAMVFKGKPCRSVTKGTTPPVICKELIVTGLLSNTKSLNFHFESGDNVGISYITSREAVVVKGVNTYRLQGYYFRPPNGKRSEVYASTGTCKALNIPNNPEVECEIEGEAAKEFWMKSTYNKK
jgi:hypothetical protein